MENQPLLSDRKAVGPGRGLADLERSVRCYRRSQSPQGTAPKTCNLRTYRLKPIEIEIAILLKYG
jgi:hypothetical protein